MKKELLATGFVLFCFTLPQKAIAAKFDALYVFGDSLSDTGNTFAATQGQNPSLESIIQTVQVIFRDVFLMV